MRAASRASSEMQLISSTGNTEATLPAGSIARLHRQYQAGRGLDPGIVTASELKAALEQRDHVIAIERFVAGDAEVGGNAGEVEVDAVAPGEGVDPIEIADALVLDQRRKRTLGDRQDLFIDGLPFGVDLAVANDVKPPAGEFFGP